MPIYQHYAQVYDQSGQLAFSLRMIPYLKGLLSEHPVAGRLMIDLACGTGTVAVAMARAGWRVWGIDFSAAMLAQARSKATDAGLEVRWSQQDMRQFALPEQVDLVTCLYDSMNYMLSSEELLAVFSHTRSALRPGGVFMFDMNTAQAFATRWNDETYFTDSDALSTVLKSQYDEYRQRTSVTVTCFCRVGDLYHKVQERHTEQAYPPEQIATFLRDAGLTVEAAYDCFTTEPPSEESARIMWVARRH